MKPKYGTISLWVAACLGLALALLSATQLRSPYLARVRPLALVANRTGPAVGLAPGGLGVVAKLAARRNLAVRPNTFSRSIFSSALNPIPSR